MRAIRVGVVAEPGMAGVKSHVVGSLRAFELDGFEVSLGYSLRRADKRYEAEINELEGRGIRCEELPLTRALNIKDDARALSACYSFLKKGRFDVLHLHSSKAGALGRLAVQCLRHKPVVVYSPHAMACYSSRMACGVERLLGTVTDQLVACSNSERADWVRWKIPGSDRAVVIPPGIASATGGDRGGQTSRDSAFLIGAAGRICAQKNAGLFFRVALEGVRRLPRAEFVWIGDYGSDAEADRVREMLRAAGSPERVRVTGWISDPRARLGELDVFCMLSRYESYGLVTAEAMSQGVPVVAMPSTGTVDLVEDGRSGLLVEDSVADIVKALHRLYADPRLRGDLGDGASLRISAEPTHSDVAAALRQLYRQLVED